MLPEARRRAILSHLAMIGSGAISDLSMRYHVSTMTIRRDLRILQAGGYITLTHGGAVYDGDSFQQNSAHHLERATIHAAEKRAIGRYVATHFIDSGDVLFLDSGTTVRAIIPFLREKADLTAATNSPLTIESLYRYLPMSNILGTGGMLGSGAQSFVGPVAERFFEDFFAQKAFISGISFSLQTGLADSKLLDTAVKQAMIRSAGSIIVVLDSSKLDHTAMAQVLPTAEIETMVTDEGIADSEHKRIIDAGIDLHVAPLS